MTMLWKCLLLLITCRIALLQELPDSSLDVPLVSTLRTRSSFILQRNASIIPLPQSSELQVAAVIQPHSLTCTQGTCPAGRCQCSNGNCIPLSYFCDGIFVDCGDGSDEELGCVCNGFQCPNPHGAGPECIPTPCVSCPSGQYGTTTCINCPTGQMCPGPGATTPTDCPPGSYQDQSGQTACIPCPTGHMCPGPAATTPTDCPAGNYQDQTGQTACIPCTTADNGGWTDWSSWTACSVTCGYGTISKYRNCTNPVPKSGCRNCSESGESSESHLCSDALCVVNGSWTDWGAWEPCSVSCSRGTQIRRRFCTNPCPANGGSYCPISDATIDRQTCSNCSAGCEHACGPHPYFCDQYVMCLNGRDISVACSKANEIQLYYDVVEKTCKKPCNATVQEGCQISIQRQC